MEEFCFKAFGDHLIRDKGYLFPCVRLLSRDRAYGPRGFQSACGDNHVDMGMPIQLTAEGMDDRGESGENVVFIPEPGKHGLSRSSKEGRYVLTVIEEEQSDKTRDSKGDMEIGFIGESLI